MTSIVTAETVRRLCGRKHVQARQTQLTELLRRAFRNEPRHNHYANCISLHAHTLRKTFGQRGAYLIIYTFFDKVGNPLAEKWATGYRLKPEIAKQIEQQALDLDLTQRAPYEPELRSVDGLRLPNRLPVSLPHLLYVTDVVRRALDTLVSQSPWMHLGSNRSVETVYRQLLDIRKTVVETGGLPNTYVQLKDSRWHGEDDQHPLRLCRPTRYLTLGDRDDLWDVDLSNAHLVIAYGLAKSRNAGMKLETFERYLWDRDTWVADLIRTLAKRGDHVSGTEAKTIARAWLYSAWGKGDPLFSLRGGAPQLNQVLKEMASWRNLKQEIRHVARFLAPANKQLSRLLSEWETDLMRRIGLHLGRQQGIQLQAWLYDGFLLVKDYNNPSAAIEGVLQSVTEELHGEGYTGFPLLGMKARSMADLCRVYLEPLAD